MGQYYVIANLDKREFIDPAVFLSGVRFTTITLNSSLALAAMSFLLVSNTSFGFVGDMMVDIETEEVWVGRWCGDRVVLAGDYDTQETSSPCHNVYAQCMGDKTELEQLAELGNEYSGWKNVSRTLLLAMLHNQEFAAKYISLAIKHGYTWSSFEEEVLSGLAENRAWLKTWWDNEREVNDAKGNQL